MSKGTGGEGTSKVPKTLPPQSGAKGKSPTAKTARLIHAPLSFVLTVSSPISFSCPLNVTLNKPACCSVLRRTARKVRKGSFPGWSGCLGLWSRGNLEKAYLNREQALPTHAQCTRQQHSFAGVCWFGLQMERRCRRRRFSVVTLGTDVLFRTVTAL